ncbi:MAG: IS1 family transposase [Armatimonadetes bacterium]|nr:IS1 family transposase [Armatimonadota bacterium]
MEQEHQQMLGHEVGEYQAIVGVAAIVLSPSPAGTAAEAALPTGMASATAALLTAVRQGAVSRQVMSDEQAALAWIKKTLHPQGLCCPRCGSKYRRVARHKGKIPAWRCTDCDRYYTMMSGTIFEKTRQSANGLLQIIHGIFQERPLTHLAQEMKMSRKQVYNIREKLAQFDSEFELLNKASQTLPA